MLDTTVNGGSPNPAKLKYTFASGGIPGSSFRVHLFGANGGDNSATLSWNGGSVSVSTTFSWYTITPSANRLQYLEVETKNMSNPNPVQPTGVTVVEIDGKELIDNGPTQKGDVDSIVGTTVALSNNTTNWVNGTDVTGPEKIITLDNAKKYLKFDSSGAVSETIVCTRSL